MQPQQGGETADWREFRPEVTANDVGVNHQIAGQRRNVVRLLDRQRADQNAGHVVHNRRQGCRQKAGAKRGGERT